MLSINSIKTVPALVHSGMTSNASTPCSTAPVTPTGEATSINFPLSLNKSSSMVGLKTRLTKFRRSTKSMFNRTVKFKSFPTEPSIIAPDKILVEQETVIEFCPALIPQYHESDEPRGSYLYIPLPRFPSQVSLIPLHDGHVLPSPAEEHDEEDTISFASLACLEEQRCIHHFESPSLGSLAPPKMTNSVMAQASQALPSEHGKEPFPASLVYPAKELNLSRVEYNRPFYSMPVYGQTSITEMTLERSTIASHFLVPLSWILISTCTVVGIAATAISGYY